MRLGFHAGDDEDNSCTTGGGVQEQHVTTNDEIEVDVSDVIAEERAEWRAALTDAAQTWLVLLCIVCGCAWTAYRFMQDLPGTSHTLYGLAKQYPGIVLIFGVWFGVVWRDWAERHPFWFATAAFFIGHSTWPLFSW